MTTAFQSNAFQQDAFQIDVVISGSIFAIDQNDSASIQGAVSTGIDTHDGFTPEEIRRAKALDKKAEKARRKLEEAQKLQKIARKQGIRALVAPETIVAEKQQTVVESQQITKEVALEKVIRASANLKRIEDQRKALYEAISLRQEQARIMTELAILRAKELDEEEAILALLM